jgi:protein TonB
MFSTLLASRPARAGASHGTAVSLTLHGAILTAAILAGMREPPVFEAPRETRVVPLDFRRAPAPVVPAAPPAAPTPATPSVPAVPAPPVPPLPTPTSIPTEIPAPSTEPWLPTAPLPVGNPSPSTGTPTAGTPTDGTALGASEVDVAAALRPTSPLPRYPDLLRAQRLEGRAVARFIVGPDGRVELNSVQIVEASHPAFAESVRSVVSRLRFSPARVGRRPVRQLVEVPFGFRVTER